MTFLRKLAARLVRKLEEGEAAVQQHALLPVLRKHDVLRRQRRCAADGRRFLARTRYIE